MEINKLLFFSLSLALILGVVQSFDYNEKELESEEALQAMYERWRDHHQVTEKSPERFNVFKATVQRVHNHNKMDKPYRLSVNMFAAMTDEEFRSNFTDNYPTRLQAAAKPEENPVPPADIKVLPPKFDWREHDAVTHVRKWFQCGFSPMLFGVVGGIEGVNALRTGTLLTLSDQFFVDCVNCPPQQLGSVPNIAKFVGEQKGVPTAKSYPTTGIRAACDKSKFGHVMVTIDGIDIFSWQTEENLQRLLLQQPIIFGMDPGEDFHVYKEGIYSTEKCGALHGHIMLLVGWDVAPDGTKYWVAKNSWSEDWGEKGYIRIKRTPKGLCNMYNYNCMVKKSMETRNIEL